MGRFPWPISAHCPPSALSALPLHPPPPGPAVQSPPLVAVKLFFSHSWMALCEREKRRRRSRDRESAGQNEDESERERGDREWRTGDSE